MSRDVTGLQGLQTWFIFLPSIGRPCTASAPSTQFFPSCPPHQRPSPSSPAGQGVISVYEHAAPPHSQSQSHPGSHPGRCPSTVSPAVETGPGVPTASRTSPYTLLVCSGPHTWFLCFSEVQQPGGQGPRQLSLQRPGGEMGPERPLPTRPPSTPGCWHICALVMASSFQDRKPDVVALGRPARHTHLALRSGHQQGDVGVLFLAQDGHRLFPVLDVHTVNLRQARVQSTRMLGLALGRTLGECREPKHSGLRWARLGLELREDVTKWRVLGRGWPGSCKNQCVLRTAWSGAEGEGSGGFRAAGALDASKSHRHTGATGVSGQERDETQLGFGTWQAAGPQAWLLVGES